MMGEWGAGRLAALDGGPLIGGRRRADGFNMWMMPRIGSGRLFGV